jgi:hypothetical protein
MLAKIFSLGRIVYEIIYKVVNEVIVAIWK